MSAQQYFDYPNFGTRTTRDVNASQAVRFTPSKGDVVELAGQGGWDRLTEKIPTESLDLEVAQAFENVDHTLKIAGATKGWEQVHFVRVYLLESVWGDDAFKALVTNMHKWCPNHPPVLTMVGVARLYGDMKIEVEVKAQIV